MPGLDRQLRRPRRRRLPGIPDPLAGRLREPGLEGFRRGAGLSRRLAGQGAQGALRAAGLCLRRLAADGGDLRCPGQARPRRGAARTRPRALFKRFNEAFWDEESGFYAFALDGDKKPVLSVASNPGHCLWSGIVPPERAARVVKRLMAPDMWSGWGIRTLSADHPAYNPHSYQNGSVWPHDNGIIASGFRRYGFAREAARIARDISAAAGYFMQHQLPELYAGLQRDPDQFPGAVPGRQRPPGLGGGIVLRTAAGDARLPAGRAGRQALYRSGAAGLDAGPDPARPARRHSGSSTSGSGATAARRALTSCEALQEPSRVGPSVHGWSSPVQCRTLCDAHQSPRGKLPVESLHALDWLNFFLARRC